MTIRKTVLYREIIETDGHGEACDPITRVVAAAVLQNPYAGRYEEDLTALFDLGGALGAIAGGGIGAYMDNQEREFRQALAGTGVSVVRNGDMLTLIMPGNVTFPTDEYSILPNFYSTLNAVSTVLRK